jgi:hypothetical protein
LKWQNLLANVPNAGRFIIQTARMTLLSVIAGVIALFAGLK